jgi:hypothetical protein
MHAPGPRVSPPLTRQTLHGTWGTVLLPIAEDSIELDAIGAQLDVLPISGLDGIYTNGTAGEFFIQTRTSSTPWPPWSLSAAGRRTCRASSVRATPVRRPRARGFAGRHSCTHPRFR